MKLALKIDVDTYRGLAEGAGHLASFLSTHKIPASFFVTLGPDTSGWAIKRFWTRPGFAGKMRRSGALAMYGWRTALSGTLLPARPMGASFKDQLRRWRDLGFEVSPHGYDHILWHDAAAGWKKKPGAEIERAFDVYRDIFKQNPASFAAPGWQAGPGTWQALDAYGLLYHSDTRGQTPYLPQLQGRDLKTLEIPTTLPTWDEMLSWPATTSRRVRQSHSGGGDVSPETLVDRTRALLLPDVLNVFTIHAEVEGGLYFPRFKEFIMHLMGETVTWTFYPTPPVNVSGRGLPCRGIPSNKDIAPGARAR